MSTDQVQAPPPQPSPSTPPPAEAAGASGGLRVDRYLALAFGFATFALMWATQRPIGYMRDEGYYFKAASDYEGWFVELWKDISAGNWSLPFSEPVIARYWSYNSEHPVLIKTLFAFSHHVFHRWTGWMDDSTAFRFPAFLIAGVVAWSLFWLARPAGRVAATLAPVLFFAAPRHFFHGHLACFDMPVVATWCLFFLAYARSIETGKGAWKAGVAFGLALATKHNAFFLPATLLPHWLLSNRLSLVTNGWKGFVARVPRAWGWIAVLGPAILYVHWPLLWHHPVDVVQQWLSFHLQHINYPWQYFGRIQKDPPFPVEYPVALEALTIPAATFLLLVLGFLLLAGRGFAVFSPTWRDRFGASSRDWLILIGATVAIAPFMTRYVPIFGGIKHWMASPALLCVPAAEVLVLLGRAVWPAQATRATGVLAGLVLIPGIWSAAHFHPYGTSAYNEIAGGGAGGAQLGMQRQYWSNNVTAVIPWLNEHTPLGARVFFHEVNMESFHAYQQNNWLRKDIGYAWSPRDAVNSGGYAVYQYMQEFRDYEFQMWNAVGAPVPLVSFAVDEAPNIVVYGRL